MFMQLFSEAIYAASVDELERLIDKINQRIENGNFKVEDLSNRYISSKGKVPRVVASVHTYCYSISFLYVA